MQRADWGRARRLLDEALERARGVQDKNAMAWALYLLGRLAWQQSRDHARATALYKEGLALSPVTRSKHQRAYALLGLGQVAEAQRAYEPAGAYYEEAFALWKEIRADWVSSDFRHSDSDRLRKRRETMSWRGFDTKTS
jgi:tetratricopeptide (TPR) repeat protein